jgi:hypothetical protein
MAQRAIEISNGCAWGMEELGFSKVNAIGRKINEQRHHFNSQGKKAFTKRAFPDKWLLRVARNGLPGILETSM